VYGENIERRTMSSTSFYGDCPLCGSALDMAFCPDTGEERLQCTECEWHEGEE